MPPTSSPARREIASTCSMIARGGVVTLDSEPGLRRVDRARTAHELDAVVRLAGVGRTEIERPDRGEDLDRVEVLAAERLDADDVAVAKRRGLLHERDAVDPELDLAALDRAGERLFRFVANDAGAAAADVRLHQHRIAKVLRGLQRERRIVDRARPRIRKPELLEQIELRRLRELVGVDVRAVDDGHADPLADGGASAACGRSSGDGRADTPTDSRD